MSKVVMHNVVSVDGFIADPDDDVGPLFEWYGNGDVHLDENGYTTVTQVSADYIGPSMAAIGAMVIGRHLFDMMDGWGGNAVAGDHVFVVSHRPRPDGWHPDAPFTFVDDVTKAVELAKQVAGDDRTAAVAAGDVGGQAFALGLVDEVAMDVVPVVFGSGKRYFGSVDGRHLLEDPKIVIQGDRVLHLRYEVRRQA
jgi:dihydrofolate reductase